MLHLKEVTATYATPHALRRFVLDVLLLSVMRMLRISWTAKARGENIRRKLRIKENIIQTIAKRKLRLFGHIQRMDSPRKLKVVVQGLVVRTNVRGRPSRTWLDDISDWGGEDVNTLARKAEDRPL